jgi:hypothetical protein
MVCDDICFLHLSFARGKLQKFEELSLTGNSIIERPPAIGCCVSMQLLDLSCCNLAAIQPEFTYLTRLLELNPGA